MFKVTSYLFIVSIFVGCASTSSTNVTYEEYKPQNSTNDVFVEKKEVKKAPILADGSIKGKVVKLTYTKGTWNYEVKGEDRSNKKLLYAKFTYTKNVAKKGDLIYAVIKNGQAEELFLISRAKVQQKNTKSIKQNKIKTYKRTKKRQVLDVPITQSISL